MSDLGKDFLDESRAFLSAAFLPRIARCVEQLTDGQIWWRANEDSNSIGNLLLHLSGNVRQWIISGLGGAADTRQRQTEFDERQVLPGQELLSLLTATVNEADAVLARLDTHKLSTTHFIQGHEVTGLYAVYHVVEHFSMHTGQIILLTKALQDSGLNFYDVTPDGVANPAW
jgi:uncharacterized damage-inducible protein DinB